MRLVHVAVALTAVNLAIVLGGWTQARSPDAPASADVLRGRALELVDERGHMRARLNVESDGQVVLRLLDQEGTIRVKLGADREGSGLLLANDATEPGIHMLAGARGSSIKVADKGGRPRIIAP